MSAAPENAPATPLSIPCSEILYRLLTKASWLSQDGGVAPAAFYRREDKDGVPEEDGLSVFISSLCSLDEARSMLQKVRGVATLHAGRIRDLGLTIIADSDDPKHAEIVGTPTRSENIDQATYYADRLSEQARLA